jgi:hypothetical protein
MYEGTNDISALTEILGRSDSSRWNCMPAAPTTMTDDTTLPPRARSTCLALPWLDPPSGRTVLTSKTHHADPDKLVFAMIKPRWYPNLVESATEEWYGHRDGCF